MSTVEYRIISDEVDVSRRRLPMQSNSRPLHRISKVRRQQGVSLRSVARKLGQSTQQVREEEDPGNDMRISDLLRWQEILDVPLVELLEDPAAQLSDPISKRATLLRIMKSAKAIKESAHGVAVIRLTNMLINQLIELMPELEEVSPWHSVGQRRTQADVGKTAENPISDNFFNDSSI